MNKIKTFIAHKNEKEAKKLIEYIEELEYVEVVGNAKTGKEACEKIAELKPEIVFTRFDMGDMNGMEMIKTTKETLEKSPKFKFITKKISKEETKSTYNKIKNNKKATVRELGKDEIITTLKQYKDTIM